MPDAPKLTLDDLIAWGRDWERHLGAARAVRVSTCRGRCCSSGSSSSKHCTRACAWPETAQPQLKAKAGTRRAARLRSASLLWS